MQGPCFFGFAQAFPLGIALVFAFGSGCARGTAVPTGRPPVAEVVGTVIHAGQPVQNAVVQFHPEGAGDRGTGHTDQNGRFTISTYGPQDGAVVGKHAVTVQPLPVAPAVPGLATPPTSGTFPAAYTSPEKTPLTVEVKAETNSFQLELK